MRVVSLLKTVKFLASSEAQVSLVVVNGTGLVWSPKDELRHKTTSFKSNILSCNEIKYRYHDAAENILRSDGQTQYLSFFFFFDICFR